jgi:cell division protein FtsB
MAAESREQARRTTEFTTEVRALSSRIDDLERQDMAQPEARKTLDEVEGAVTRLGSVSGLGADASAAFTAQRKRVSALRAEVDSLVRAEQERRDEASQLQALDSAIDDPERFCRLLSEFAQRFPQSPYSSQFAEVAGQCGPQVAIVRWNETAAQIAGDPFPAEEADRSRIRGFLQRYRAANPTSPVDSAVRRYEELLADSSAWTQWLSNTLRTWTPLETNQVMLKSGIRVFYDMKDRPITRGTESSIYSVWKNWKAGEKQSQVIARKEIASDGASPQFALREQIEKIIGGRAARTDGLAALQVVQTIRDDTKVDPIARAMLLEGLLPHVQVALPNLKQQIERTIGLLGQLNLAAVDWMAPCVPESRREHGKAADALRLDVPVESWIAERRQAMDAIREWVRSKMRPVGVIDSIDPKRPLRVGLGVRLQPGEGLFVVNDSGSLLQIGKVGANGAPLLDALPRTQPSGSLVFAGTDRVPRSPKGAK